VPDSRRHAARIALATIRLPAALEALAWIEDSILEAATADRLRETKERSR
jgi:hypothetical protein